MVNRTSSQSSEDEIMLWQQRLGHPSFPYLQKLFPLLIKKKVLCVDAEFVNYQNFKELIFHYSLAHLLLCMVICRALYVRLTFWELDSSVVKSKRQCQGDRIPFSLRQKVKNKAIT